MQLQYKNYRVETKKTRGFFDFDVYLGPQCVATGYLTDEGLGDFSALYAQNLIDRGFETPVLESIRKLPKY